MTRTSPFRPARPSRRTRLSRALTGPTSIIVRGAICALCFALAPIPTAAEWLVTRDGQRLETEGAWRASSRSTYFQQKDGASVSIPTAQIDIEASRRLSRAMRTIEAQPVDGTETEVRRSVLRLTDDDVRNISPRSVPGTASPTPFDPDAILAENGAAPTVVAVRNWLDAESQTMVIEGRLELPSPGSPSPSQVTIELLEGASVVAHTVANVDLAADLPHDQVAFRGVVPAPSGPRMIRVTF